jgi:hypothetical protein
MSINIPDLGKDFSVRAINDNNSFSPAVDGTAFNISPGTYLITRKGVTSDKRDDDPWKNIRLKEFSAPEANLHETHVLHTPSEVITEGSSYVVDALIAAINVPDKVTVSMLAGFRPKVYEMKKVSGYRYAVTIPAEEIKEGFLRYFITVGTDKKQLTYPSGVEGSPSAWDFDAHHPFEVKILPTSSPVYLFDALTDNDELSRVWNKSSSFAPAAEPGKAEIRVNVEKLFIVDPENPKAQSLHDYSMRYYFGKKIEGLKKTLIGKKEIIFRGRSLETKPCWIQLALLTRKGEAFGGVVKVESTSADYKVPISALERVKLVTLPRPYPTFLSYFFDDKRSTSLNIEDIETLQISIGPGIPESELSSCHAVAIESVRLE